MAEVPAVAEALSSGESEVWVDGGRSSGARTSLVLQALIVGALIVGYRVDDALADLVGRHLGAGVAVLLDGELVAASARLATNRCCASLGCHPTRHAVTGSGGPQEGTARRSALPSQHDSAARRDGQRDIRVVLLRSLDGALAAARRLVWTLPGITAVAPALATAAGLQLSRRLSQPIDDLAAFAQRIAGAICDRCRSPACRRSRRSARQ